mgnify:FL=1
MERKSRKIVVDKKTKKIKRRTNKPLIIGLLFSLLVLVTIVCSFAIEKTINKESKEAVADAVDSQNITEKGTIVGNEDENVTQSQTEATESETETTTQATTEATTQAESTTEQESSTDTNSEKGQGEYPGVKKVYLTFDDGPSSITSQILDVLDSYGVKATFFTVCHTDEEAIENMQRIVNDGHTIAIHSLTHSYSQVYASLSSFKEDVLGMQQFIYDNTGYKTFLYRFPGGSSNTIAKCDIGECIDFLDDAGVEYFDWNVESGDATANMLPKDIIVNNVLSSLGDNEEYVVLMHDAEPKKTTLEALPEIIEGIQSRGYEILPITENTKPVHHRRKNKF